MHLAASVLPLTTTSHNIINATCCWLALWVPKELFEGSYMFSPSLPTSFMNVYQRPGLFLSLTYRHNEGDSRLITKAGTCRAIILYHLKVSRLPSGILKFAHEDFIACLYYFILCCCTYFRGCLVTNVPVLVIFLGAAKVLLFYSGNSTWSSFVIYLTNLFSFFKQARHVVCKIIEHIFEYFLTSMDHGKKRQI